MKHITFAISTSILIIITGIVHRVIFRLFGFPFDEALFFWGGFVVVYFVIALIASLLFRNVGSSSSRRYQA
ncbi:bacteriocin-like WGxF protein [Bacillus inaquosorum]|uniref:bacteriocin-like WGxF protein n=1 Tax=Bacillus inaquosorum TaxID=483913 RepID=UPI002282D299|nr:bacteriocin-like WGxF protein [Bacillus inaquosorum]MCY7750706.1 bacteriocin-like WGxF protein [Bacillus inaquosorum]MCY7981749.1 bacteriocin-like WGxF protein [Bacillus inaquosorum]MCY8028572.1 bacteriocin-like WGxF protein [Bacillus inaquosorum]MCY8186050.1 bacteriocin-like WGxF protein [Bacillus inaquosorum]MCY8282019.1 bacteriocin-like WGxF protein [Bacillus inaquosorum]